MDTIITSVQRGAIIMVAGDGSRPLPFCEGLAGGCCRQVVSDRTDDLLATIKRLGPAELQGRRFIALVWNQLPPVPRILDEVLDRLADCALSLWPDWNASAPEQPVRGMSNPGVSQGKEPIDTGNGRLNHWLELATRAVQSGRAPRFKRVFTANAEVRQLTRVIGSPAVQLLLVVRDPSQASAALLGLARTTEWLAKETEMPVIVVVPSQLASAVELDSISFDTVQPGEVSALGLTAVAGPKDSLPSSHFPLEDSLSSLENEVSHGDEVIVEGFHLDRSSEFDIEAESGAGTEPSRFFAESREQPRSLRRELFIHPLIGRPHPGSQGEQLLWSRLCSDRELAGLFECNVWVTTSGGEAYLVDFVWRNGRVIVEVDGYYWHATPIQFVLDRHRDYELLISGYRVMRVPHDVLLLNPDRVVEKIRRLVQLR